MNKYSLILISLLIGTTAFATPLEYPRADIHCYNKDLWKPSRDRNKKRECFISIERPVVLATKKGSKVIL